VIKSEKPFLRSHFLRNTLIGLASIALLDGTLSASTRSSMDRATNVYDAYFPNHDVARHFEDTSNGTIVLTLTSAKRTLVSNESTNTTVLAQGTESGILEPYTLEPAGPAKLPTMYDARLDPSKYVAPEILSLVRIVKTLG
jgi:hypothetical protein